VGNRLAETGAKQGETLGLFTGEGMANKPRYGLRSSGLLCSVGWHCTCLQAFGQHIGPHSKLNYKAVGDQKPANRVTFAHVSLILRAIVNTRSDWMADKQFNTHAPDIRQANVATAPPSMQRTDYDLFSPTNCKRNHTQSFVIL